jgi:hypothetical protein
VTSSEIPTTDSRQWRCEYAAALAEKNKPALFKRVEIAEAALFNRQEALMQSSDGHIELREIASALKNLRRVKRDVLNFR